ncbi:J domain-containing protein [Balneolales bacterium ANBcel1]|nr:J domain-containing protein [Balneolales bacterium ANBcel1]
MNYKDYYKTLGVGKQASKDEIKKAYRKLARKHHPDVNPDDKGAAKKFNEISEAYEVLGNDENRKLYDQLGADWKHYKRAGEQGGGQSGGFNWQQWARDQGAGRAGRQHRSQTGGDFFSGGDFSEFFEQVFGGGFGRSQQQQRRTRPGADFRDTAYQWGADTATRKGKDVNAELEISLEEAYKGVEKSVRVNKRPMKIKVPKGIPEGRKLKLRGKGLPGTNGGEAGDLYIRIKIKPHDVFTREGDDLYTTIDVGLYQLLLGGVVTVPTMTGNVKIKVPPESQPGKVMRIAGYGMPVLQSEEKKGHLYATLQVKLPEKLTGKEKKLFRELADIRGEKTA